MERLFAVGLGLLKLGSEEVLVIKRHGQREDSSGVAILRMPIITPVALALNVDCQGPMGKPRGAVGGATMFAKCTSM